MLLIICYSRYKPQRPLSVSEINWVREKAKINPLDVKGMTRDTQDCVWVEKSKVQWFVTNDKTRIKVTYLDNDRHNDIQSS